MTGVRRQGVRVLRNFGFPVSILALSAFAVLLVAACGDDATEETPTPSAAPTGGSLGVTPASGSVGTVVEITGSGCSYPGKSAIISFQGGLSTTSTGTYGSLLVRDIEVDEQNAFIISFTIPEVIGGYQGQGGGQVVPGTYEFGSRPPFCQADFSVTESPSPSLAVTPASGPVGTVVEMSGSGCTGPGRPDTLAVVFEQGDPGLGTLGSTGLPDIPVEDDSFTTSFIIPGELNTLQGQGGGAVTPGQYYFGTKPPACSATFTVTG